MTADQEDLRQGWTVKLRLAIDADNADEARAIAEEVWRKMEVTAGAEPQITRSAGRAPHWNIITDLDLSAVEPITPDDAVTRFRYVIRHLPGVVFDGPATDNPRFGQWQWLPDSWELDWQPQELAHPAVRAAGIRITVLAKKNRYPDLQVRIPANSLRSPPDIRKVPQMTASQALPATIPTTRPPRPAMRYPAQRRRAVRRLVVTCHQGFFGFVCAFCRFQRWLIRYRLSVDVVREGSFR